MATDNKTILTPLEDRIVAEKNDLEEKTSGGIVLPDSAKEKPPYAVIISIGPGKKDDNGNLIPITDLKPGDKIIYARHSGIEVKIEGKDYTIFRSTDILAKIET